MVRHPFGGVWNGIARLKIYEDALEIGPILPWLQIVIHYWRVALEELTIVEAVTRRRMRFRTPDDFRVFYSFFLAPWRRTILELLEELGVPVDFEPEPFDILFPGE